MERHPENPIITRKNIPSIPPDLVDVSSVFNPGAVKFKEKYLLMLRVQNRGRETFFLMADSPDGVHFDVSSKPVHFRGIEEISEPVYHCYDARISKIEGVFYIMFAVDMDSGCRLGLARTFDFEDFEFLGLTSTGDNRNGVLFPEKIRGRYMRLDRPNRPVLEGGPTSGSAIYLSESEDLLQWSEIGPLIEGRFHYWDELIGAGPPPLKTREGWIQVYHGVAKHLSSSHIYQAGVMLLDLEDPLRVIGRCPFNVLEPREDYEMVGQVPNVVFPSGLIAQEIDGEGFAVINSPVFLYYGAADTSVCLAKSTVKEFIDHAMLGN
ncbi:glycoside hydrolase family 130 protein [Acidobacteriota bacterium]